MTLHLSKSRNNQSIAFILLTIYWSVTFRDTQNHHYCVDLQSHLRLPSNRKESFRKARNLRSLRSATMKSVSAINLLTVCVLMSQVLQSSSLSNTRHYIHRMRRLSMSIAPYKTPRAQNAPGNLFVDEGEEWSWVDQSDENSHLTKNE